MGCKPRGRRFCLQFALKYCMLIIKTARQSCKGRTYAARDLAFTAYLPYTAGPGIPGPYTSTKEKAIMQIIEITDLSIPELAPYTKLTESQLRNRLEPEKGIFIAESPKVIGTALDAGCEPLSFLMERRQIDGPAAGVLARCPDATVYTADRSVLQVLTGYVLTRGVLCAMRRPALPTVEEVCANARRIAVLENVMNPTNIGAIFRCAAALVVPGERKTDGADDDKPYTIASETVEVGEMPGVLLRAPRGANGFGYDPLFVPNDQPQRAVDAGEKLTSAEMEPAEKNAVSHRGKALRALVASIEALVK